MSFLAPLRAGAARRQRASGLFLCHAPCDRVFAHYKRLREESAGLVDWTLVIDQGHLEAPRGAATGGHPSVVMPRRFAAARTIGRLTAGAGMMDTVIMPRVLAAPHEFVWVLEFDVDYSGTWSDLFRRFAGNRADVLTTTLTPRARCPDWVHWPQARAPAALRAADWFRSFNPVLRLSRRFARGYIATIESPGWEGHYEFTIPTIARHLRLGIEDIARPGRRMHGMKLPVWLVPHARPALYRNTPAAPWLGPGTFIYRPSRSSYFHERPEEFPEAGRLYHPIKPA